MVTFLLNGESVTVHSSFDTPLLWVLREELKHLGTKFGCGAGLCGACTVILDGTSTRSCLLPIASIAGKSVQTIEGLGGEHPVQRAWIDGNVAQCGYCQSGQIMTTVALLETNSQPTEAEIKSALAGNICRCGTYQRIIEAVNVAAEMIIEQQVEPEPTALYYDAADLRAKTRKA